MQERHVLSTCVRMHVRPPNIRTHGNIAQASISNCPVRVPFIDCAVLCCAVLCCAVLCCAVLCCAVLCCAVLCCAVLCCAVLCCAVLCCAVLCCAVLCCAVQYISIPFKLIRLTEFNIVNMRDEESVHANSKQG